MVNLDDSKLIYEGKAKKVYESEDSDTCYIYFKDTLTAFDGIKKDEMENKGKLNCKITSLIFDYLQKNGIKTHFIEKIDDNTIKARKVKILPIEVVVRNIAAGSFCRRYGVEEGRVFDHPMVEFFLKDDALHDPLLSEGAIIALNLVTRDELEYLKHEALKLNELLKKLMDAADIILVDMKFEFGKASNGEILLADEITPDAMRLWDKKTLKVLDKDRFRKDLGEVVESYEEIYNRLEKAIKRL